MEVTLDKRGCALLLERNDVNGSTLMAILMTLLGEEVWESDPIELFTALEEAFGVRITEYSENRINAMLLAASGPEFFNDPDTFRLVCSTLATGEVADPADDALTTGESELSLGDMRSGMYEVELMYDAEVPTYGKRVQEAFFREASDTAAEDGLADALTDSAEVLAHTKADILRELTQAGFKNVVLPE